MNEIVTIKDLVIKFYTYEGVVHAIEHVDLAMRRGETLGIIGETGCGKSVTALSIMNLILPPGRVEGGEVTFERGDTGISMLHQSDETLRDIRGKEISIIFQDPGSALNPVYHVGDQIAEAILLHRGKTIGEKALRRIEKQMEEGRGAPNSYTFGIQRSLLQRHIVNPESRLVKLVARIPLLRRYRRRLDAEAEEEVVVMLRELEIADPARVSRMYPHELSGGMQQRVMIAMALACNPKLLIADEPTTALDVTVQAQILDLIRRLKARFGSSVLYITHDMGIVAEICDRVAVMYAGTVCEVADVGEIYGGSLHPYAKALLESIPQPGHEFKTIPGFIPSLIEPPPGCRFHPRCQHAMDVCRKEIPEMNEAKPGHWVACHLHGGKKQ